LARANGAAAQTAAIQLHALAYNWTRENIGIMNWWQTAWS